MANHNRDGFLSEAIGSILSQTYTHLELVIVDDGSTDHSMEIISGFQKTDPRIVVYRHKLNQGCGAAMRKCAELAKGELLCLVGSDDVLVPEAVEKLVDGHREFPLCSLVYSTHFVCDEKLNILRLAYGAMTIPQGESYLTYGKGITGLASFTKKHYALTAGIDATFKRAVDQDLYYKLEEAGQVHFVNQPLCKYRVNTRGISTHTNIHKSRYWFGLAKENAFRRRLAHQTVKNIDQGELDAWWSLVYANKSIVAFRAFRLGAGFCWMMKSLRKSIIDRYTVLKFQSLFLDTFAHRWYKQWQSRRGS